MVRKGLWANRLRIPTEAGQVIRREVGRRSDAKWATAPM